MEKYTTCLLYTVYELKFIILIHVEVFFSWVGVVIFHIIGLGKVQICITWAYLKAKTPYKIAFEHTDACLRYCIWKFWHFWIFFLENWFFMVFFYRKLNYLSNDLRLYLKILTFLKFFSWKVVFHVFFSTEN